MLLGREVQKGLQSCLELQEMVRGWRQEQVVLGIGLELCLRRGEPSSQGIHVQGQQGNGVGGLSPGAGVGSALEKLRLLGPPHWAPITPSQAQRWTITAAQIQGSSIASAMVQCAMQLADDAVHAQQAEQL